MIRLSQPRFVSVATAVVLSAVGCSSPGSVKGGGSGGQSGGIGAGGVAGLGGGPPGDGGAPSDQGGGGAGGSPADGGPGGDALGNQPSCMPVLNSAGADTGFESCDDGTNRRRAVIVCPLPAMRSADAGAPPPGPCATDADCGVQAICAEAHNLRGYSGCWRGCRQDSDCGADSICVCGVILGECMPASCKTNADCGAGYGCVATGEGQAGACARDMAFSTPRITRYVCQQPADTCFGSTTCPGGVPADLPARGSSWPACLYDGTKRVCGYACAGPV